MTRRDLALQALLVFVVALLVRILAASIVVFPQPEDTAYYVGVARNLLDGHGLTSNAIWSFQTPPLSFPRPAFEVWLPLPSFLAAIPMAVMGATFAASQWMAIVLGAIVPVLAWRLAADIAEERDFSRERARTPRGPMHAAHHGRPATVRCISITDHIGPNRLRLRQNSLPISPIAANCRWKWAHTYTPAVDPEPLRPPGQYEVLADGESGDQP